MHSLNRRIRHASEDDRDAVIHPRFSRATWVAVAIGGGAVLGTGAALIGANKQSKDQAGSDAANRAAIAKSDQNAWINYLIQRGLYAPGAATGTIPGAQPGSAQNTKLPLWAQMSFTQPASPAGTSMVRRRTRA